VHLESQKQEYLADKARGRDPGYEADYARDLSRYIDECNRRIDAAQRRLDKTPDEITRTNALLKMIGDFDRSISTGLLEVEVLGEQGQVARALEEYHKVRTAKAEKDNKEVCLCPADVCMFEREIADGVATEGVEDAVR